MTADFDRRHELKHAESGAEDGEIVFCFFAVDHNPRRRNALDCLALKGHVIAKLGFHPGTSSPTSHTPLNSYTKLALVTSSCMVATVICFRNSSPERPTSATINMETALENFARIIFEIAAEIRRRVPPSFIVSIKLNSAEFHCEGFDPEECKRLCEQLETFRFDFFELSGDTYEELAFKLKRDSSGKREAFFPKFADIITPLSNRRRLSSPTVSRQWTPW